VRMGKVHQNLHYSGRHSAQKIKTPRISPAITEA
jgi:hypothetical protein